MASKLELDRLHESLLVRNESKLERDLLLYFTILYNAMIQSLGDGDILTARGQIQKLEPQLQEILEESYLRSSSDGVDLMDTMLPEEDYSAETVLIMLGIWAASESVSISKIITNTTLKEFEELIASNTTDGSLDIPADDIIKELRKRNRDRTGTIGTTESNKGLGEGQRQVATELQRTQVFTVVKSWRSKRDMRVRETHARADSRYSRQPIAENQNFEVGMGFGQYPLDETLPLKEKIGCRCYAIYTKRRNI